MGTAAGSVDLELPRLVWGIESEVALIGSLCGRIDQHVRALNLARAEAARRLEALDALVAAAEDPQL